MTEDYSVIDAHCHVYPARIAERATAATEEFYDFTHAHLGGTPERLLEDGMSAGIDRFLIQSVATDPRQVRSIDTFIHECVCAYPDRFVGLGTMHPDTQDAAADARLAVSLGLHGVKIHPDIQGVAADDPRFEPIYAACAAEGLPILMHTGDRRLDFSNPNRTVPLLRSHPDLTVICAHFGGFTLWEEAAEALAGVPNAYFDCSSAVRFLPAETSVRLIRLLGADRVMFGSDYPMWSPAEELRTFLALPLTEEERRMILCTNARRVYRI